MMNNNFDIFDLHDQDVYDDMQAVLRNFLPDEVVKILNDEQLVEYQKVEKLQKLQCQKPATAIRNAIEPKSCTLHIADFNTNEEFEEVLGDLGIKRGVHFDVQAVTVFTTNIRLLMGDGSEKEYRMVE